MIKKEKIKEEKKNSKTINIFVFDKKDILLFTAYCVGCGIFAGVGVYKGDMAMVHGGFMSLLIILIVHVVLKIINHIHTAK